jgi:hypothetical protein
MRNVAAGSRVLRPFDARLAGASISRTISHVVNDDEECSRAEEPAQIQNRLLRLVRIAQLSFGSYALAGFARG